MAKKEDNLIPFTSEQSREEAKKNGHKGGIKSGESRRKRKTLKEELLALLDDEDVQKNLAVALIKEATEGNKSGSVRGAFETIRDTIGEKPIDKQEIQIAEKLEDLI